MRRATVSGMYFISPTHRPAKSLPHMHVVGHRHRACQMKHCRKTENHNVIPSRMHGKTVLNVLRGLYQRCFKSSSYNMPRVACIAICPLPIGFLRGKSCYCSLLAQCEGVISLSEMVRVVVYCEDTQQMSIPNNNSNHAPTVERRIF